MAVCMAANMTVPSTIRRQARATGERLLNLLSRGAAPTSARRDRMWLRRTRFAARQQDCSRTRGYFPQVRSLILRVRHDGSTLRSVGELVSDPEGLTPYDTLIPRQHQHL